MNPDIKQISIPFNKPYIAGKELSYISDAIGRGKLSGDGFYTKSASSLLQDKIKSKKVLLTQSCTAALEMAALLLDLSPGDEFILPSYTFVSTANAFVLRGCTPVFVDISPTTLNIDPQKIRHAITKRTKAIVVVHYAGVACDMVEIRKIAQEHAIIIVEDAAQAIGTNHTLGMLGGIGTFGCLSFHETKNINCGEGGALLVNDESFSERAEIAWEKGTNRRQFAAGVVNKYSWVGIGSSFLPSEITAAFLMAQLEELDVINDKRMTIWRAYYNFFSELDSHFVAKLKLRWNIQTDHNAHMFYVLFATRSMRDSFIEKMRNYGILCIFHYIPLHSSEFGRRVRKDTHDLPVTDEISNCIVRLPIWPELISKISFVLNCIELCLKDLAADCK